MGHVYTLNFNFTSSYDKKYVPKNPIFFRNKSIINNVYFLLILFLLNLMQKNLVKLKSDLVSIKKTIVLILLGYIILIICLYKY